MNTEKWKDIPGHAGRYQASDMGRIRSLPMPRSPGKILTPQTTNTGHCKVHLGRNFRDRLVHRLIIETFLAPAEEGMECCHNNGNPSDNRLSNLRWDTRKGNHADKIIHGTTIRGSVNHKAKLHESDIPIIRAMSNGGALGKDIAKKFGVTAANISSVLMGKTWSHLPGEPK